MSEEAGILHNITNLLERDYRGINIAVYALATAGLAVSIHKIRPVSKFSKATKVPDHFIKRHEPLRGVYAGVQHSPVRVLVDHKAPIYLPLWHSSKPPLPVKLWGVDIVSGNAVNWLECVAKGQKVTLKPIARDKDDLVSTVLLHLPQSKTKTVETLDIGQKLVELGFAKASVPQQILKNSIESQLAPAILSAEARAKNYRNGVWSDKLPPIPVYVVYWRKGSQLTVELAVLTTRKLLQLLAIVSKGALLGVKNLALRPFRSTPKQVQAT
ncbi:protein C3orf33 homolog [Aphomia sociella]